MNERSVFLRFEVLLQYKSQKWKRTPHKTHCNIVGGLGERYSLGGHVHRGRAIISLTFPSCMSSPCHACGLCHASTHRDLHSLSLPNDQCMAPGRLQHESLVGDPVLHILSGNLGRARGSKKTMAGNARGTEGGNKYESLQQYMFWRVGEGVANRYEES